MFSSFCVSCTLHLNLPLLLCTTSGSVGNWPGKKYMQDLNPTQNHWQPLRHCYLGLALWLSGQAVVPGLVAVDDPINRKSYHLLIQLGPVKAEASPSQMWYSQNGIIYLRLLHAMGRACLHHLQCVRNSLVCCWTIPIFTPQPSGLEGYCHHGLCGRAGGRWGGPLPYLCNRLTDFLHLKFCGII